MAGEIKIYGRLHAQTAEGILADASEIIDGNFGKTQEEINQKHDETVSGLTNAIENETEQRIMSDENIVNGVVSAITEMNEAIVTESDERKESIDDLKNYFDDVISSITVSMAMYYYTED